MELHAHGGGHGGVSGQTQWRSDGFARALFDARGGAAARKRFWVSSETSLIVEVRRTRENIGDRVVLGGNARLAAHLGSGAPAAADLGSGARAREIAAPGEEAGAVGGVSSGRGAREDRGRTREDRAVLGSREETPRAYHGVSSHDVHCLVHEHLRGHERGDGDGADHRLASLEVHLAQDRGVHGHTRVSRKPRRHQRFSRRARSSATARWFSSGATTKTSPQPRDVTTRTVTRARVNENPTPGRRVSHGLHSKLRPTLTQCFFATASPRANSSRVLRATRPPRARAASRP